MRYKALGLLGLPYSGKTTISRIFEKKLGYTVIQPSTILIEKIKERGLPVLRQNLEETYRMMADKEGMDILAKLTLKRAGNIFVVIDGIRRSTDLEYYKSHVVDLFSISVDVSEDIEESRRIRFERMLAARRSIDQMLDWSSFCQMELSELGPDQYLDLGRAMEKADKKIINSGSERSLENRIKKMASEMFEPYAL